jgi:RND family efflux transporter MFP subunit
MKHRLLALLCSSAGLVLLTALVGCQSGTPPPASEPPVVTVAYPVRKQVTDYKDFTGRTAAPDMVDIRARVTGYIVKMPFKEGEEVKKDQVLVEIDPRPYKAEVDKADASLKLREANYKLAIADYQRARMLARTPGAISRQELDSYAAKEIESKAAVASARAALEGTQLTLDYCKVLSPIDGRVSNFYLTIGNLVTQDQTKLTTVVSVDPMYVYVDVDERTMLHVQTLIREGKVKASSEEEYPLYLGLANEEGHPHKGTINFVDNRVNPSTGTLRVRGVFANPMIKGSRVLSPGLFARVRIPIGDPHPAILVSDRALGTDQGQKFLYVVNDKNEVVYRRVKVGALHGGLREVTEGLKPGERVIVNGLQRVRPGVTVNPKAGEMIPAAGTK